MIPTPVSEPGEAPLTQREPVRVALAGLAVVVVLALEATNQLGWTDLDRPQLAAIQAFVAGACAWVAKILRAVVTSPATAAELARGDRR